MSESHTARAKPIPNNLVICASRRTDVPANYEQLVKVLDALSAGVITYDHPRFARNKDNIKMCTVSLVPSQVRVIDWWSKDYDHLIKSWPAYSDTLSKYGHHFTFTINGEAHSHLEPGLQTTLHDRIAQLCRLVDICKEFGQNPDASIMVHFDPISVYSLVGIGKEKSRLHTLGHAGLVCDTMKKLGLTRLHISFTQFCWRGVRSRMKKLEKFVKIYELTPTEQKDIIERYLLPHTKGIQIQTCTADGLVRLYKDIGQNSVVMGSCVGRQDIIDITGKDLPEERKRRMTTTKAAKGSESTRLCTCFPSKDIGSTREPCTHGCRYCFMNPKLYSF